MLLPKKRPVTVYVYSILAVISALLIFFSYIFEILPDEIASLCTDYVFFDLMTLMMTSAIFLHSPMIPVFVTIIVLILSSVMMYTRWIKEVSIIMLVLFCFDVALLLLMMFELYEALFFVIFRILIIFACYYNIKWSKKQAEVKPDKATQ